METLRSRWVALTKWRWSATLAIGLGALFGVASAVLVIPERIEHFDVALDGARLAQRTEPPTPAAGAAIADRANTEARSAEPPRAEPTPQSDDALAAPLKPPAYDLPAPPPPPMPAPRAPDARVASDDAQPFPGGAPHSIRLLDSARNPPPAAR